MEFVDDYLLDNNIISICIREEDNRRDAVIERLRGVRGKVHLPWMAIAEIHCGLAKSSDPKHPERRRLEEFLLQYPLRLGFGEHTVEPYSRLRAQLWADHGTPRKTGRGHVEKLPEELHERVTGDSLGIDERDLLIVSVAIEYNLVFATNDGNRGMRRIEEAAKKLEDAGRPIRLRVDRWPRAK